MPITTWKQKEEEIKKDVKEISFHNNEERCL